jgi:hypothetical protein
MIRQLLLEQSLRKRLKAIHLHQPKRLLHGHVLPGTGKVSRDGRKVIVRVPPKCVKRKVLHSRVREKILP